MGEGVHNSYGGDTYRKEDLGIGILIIHFLIRIEYRPSLFKGRLDLDLTATKLTRP